MDVSIIIVNYNTGALTVAAIESVLKKTTDVTFEIIVVDNNSNDNSGELLYEKFGESVKYLSLPQNIGFGRANNAGLEVCKGRYVLFLNPDTLLRNNAIKILSNYLDKHSNVGVVGGNLFDKNGKPTSSHNKIMPSIFDEIDQAALRFFSHLFYGKHTLFNYSNKPINVGFIVGADMMVRREILNTVGGFDPSFFMYYEETELTFRIKKTGYLVQNIPWAEITHLEGGSFSQSRQRELRSLRSRKIYFQKTHGEFYGKLADINYLCIAKLSLWFCKIFRIKIYVTKLEQRLSILKEIKQNAQKT